MQNNHPKSELAGIKEKAAKAKDQHGLQQSTQGEKQAHDGVTKPRGPVKKP